jgi:four helix bundle protein
MTTSIICDRAFEFADRILNLSTRIWDRGPAARHIASQLMRCGTSIGSNAEEAQEGQSKADYIAKMAISRKEARETCWWLRLATKSGVVTSSQIKWEQSEANQLLLMIRATIRRAQASHTEVRERRVFDVS